MQLSRQSFASKFHASNLSDLKSFSYEDEEKELVENCPVSYRMVSAAATNKKSIKRNKIKDADSVKRICLSGIGILLNACNKNLNAHHMYTRMILYRGGANKMTFRRLAARGLCLSYQTTLKNQSNLAQNYDAKLLQRKKTIEATFNSNSDIEKGLENEGAAATNGSSVGLPKNGKTKQRRAHHPISRIV